MPGHKSDSDQSSPKRCCDRAHNSPEPIEDAWTKHQYRETYRKDIRNTHIH